VLARRKLELEQRPARLRDVPLAPRNLSPVERAKLQLGDLTAFAEQYTRINGAGQGSCPLHPPDNHPSFAITPDGRRWTCFHENVGGDVLDLFMRLEKISSYKEALSRLTSL
jgi:DNA primase